MIGGWKSGLYAFLLALAVFTVFFSVVTMARAQEEIGLEGVSQKELEGLPVREGGVLEQTWDWFVGLFGYEVPDAEVVKRSIVGQDLDIEDVRLVDVENAVFVNHSDVNTVYTENPTCEWIEANSSWRSCSVPSEVVKNWTERRVTSTYQVIVTPTQTYDVPDKTTCYDEGVVVVCESTLRCDGLPGIEFGCEHVIIKKEPLVDGSVESLNVGRAPIRGFVSRKQVLLSPELVSDASFTKRLPSSIVDEAKATIIPIEEVILE
jgi:hypothetical protein